MKCSKESSRKDNQSLCLNEDTEEGYAKVLGIYLVRSRLGPLKPFLGDGVCVSIYYCGLLPLHKQCLSCKTTLGRSKQLWPQTCNLTGFLETGQRSKSGNYWDSARQPWSPQLSADVPLVHGNTERVFLPHNLSFTRYIICHFIHCYLENYRFLTLGSRNYILVLCLHLIQWSN